MAVVARYFISKSTLGMFFSWLKVGRHKSIYRRITTHKDRITYIPCHLSTYVRGFQNIVILFLQNWKNQSFSFDTLYNITLFIKTCLKLKIGHDHYQNVPFGGIKSSPVPKPITKDSANHIENMNLRHTNMIWL